MEISQEKPANSTKESWTCQYCHNTFSAFTKRHFYSFFDGGRTISFSRCLRCESIASQFNIDVFESYTEKDCLETISILFE